VSAAGCLASRAFRSVYRLPFTAYRMAAGSISRVGYGSKISKLPTIRSGTSSPMIARIAAIVLRSATGTPTSRRPPELVIVTASRASKMAMPASSWTARTSASVHSTWTTHACLPSTDTCVRWNSRSLVTCRTSSPVSVCVGDHRAAGIKTPVERFGTLHGHNARHNLLKDKQWILTCIGDDLAENDAW
jgi:hypothetical protein